MTDRDPELLKGVQVLYAKSLFFESVSKYYSQAQREGRIPEYFRLILNIYQDRWPEPEDETRDFMDLDTVR